MQKIALLLAAVIGISTAPTAHANGVMIEANGARAQSTWGGELGVGYNFSVAGFTIRPIGGVLIHEGDNDRYYKDTMQNGQTRCRDSSNGQFAKDSECNNMAFKAYGKVEATYTFPRSIEVGGGARFSGEKVRAYGTLSMPIAPKLRLKANGGDRYYALGLRANF